MVPAVSRRIPRVPRYSGSRPAARRFGYGAFTLSGAPFQTPLLAICVHYGGPTTPGAPERPRFGLVPVRSPLLGESRFCSLLLWVLRCFSSPRSPVRLAHVTGLQPAGLPHSDTRGSMGVCPSPRIFAAYRVLHRLREPRYPPSALLFFSSNRAIQARVSYCLVSFHHVKDLSFVENKGLEPLTPCVQGRCSKPTELIPRSVVVPGRVELPTSTLSVWRSNQLSYGTVCKASPRKLPSHSLASSPVPFLKTDQNSGKGRPSLRPRTPERRCSSRTFRYGYLVTT